MRTFPRPFIFPSGQACNTFDQLALACYDNWDTARELLRDGMFSAFLGGLGRADLALAAREAARQPDQDRGLDQLLSSLPTQNLPAAKLKAEPGRIHLGTLRVGQDARTELYLGNLGKGLLHGSIACDDTLWLAVGCVLLLPAIALFSWFVLLPSQRGVRTALGIANGYLSSRTNMRLAAASIDPNGRGLRLEAPRMATRDQQERQGQRERPPHGQATHRRG